MKFLFKIALVTIFVFSFNESKANTLLDSLKSAYLNNPKLNAERANMRASKEEKRYIQYIINIITDSDSLRFIAYDFIFWVIMIPPIASFCYQFDGIFVGASQTSEMRNSMIISVILYILFSYFCIYFLKNHGLWLSLLLFMIIRSVTLNFFLPKILRKF